MNRFPLYLQHDAMPRALFVWSAVTLAAGIAVVVAAVRILLWVACCASSKGDSLPVW